MVPHLGHAKIMAVVVAAAVFYVGIGQRQKEDKCDNNRWFMVYYCMPYVSDLRLQASAPSNHL